MKKLKNSNTKLDNKIQDLINPISKGLERGRFESDDNTIEVKIANIVDYKLPNYKSYTTVLWSNLVGVVGLNAPPFNKKCIVVVQRRRKILAVILLPHPP